MNQPFTPPAVTGDTRIGAGAGTTAATSSLTGETGASNLSNTFETGEGAYTFTEDDFPNGCLIVTDALSGRRMAIGENKLGLTVKVALDVPLCGGCDAPLDAGVCADCALVYVEHISPGRIAA